MNYAVAATSRKNYYCHLLVTADSKADAIQKFREFLTSNEDPCDTGYDFDADDIATPEANASEWYRLTRGYDDDGKYLEVVITDAGACG